jgi:hypothetical protein
MRENLSQYLKLTGIVFDLTHRELQVFKNCQCANKNVFLLYIANLRAQLVSRDRFPINFDTAVDLEVPG